MPPDNVARREPGTILDRGWRISRTWGTANGEEYLEYFAEHPVHPGQED